MRIGLNSPQAVVALLIRRRWWVITPFVALTSLVVVLTWNLPKTFISETLILVQPREVPANFVPDLIGSSVDERLRAIAQTVLSRTNLLDVAREFGDQLPELKRLSLDARVQKLRDQIAITWDPAAAGGRIPIAYFRIAYQNQDRFMAQKIAAKIALLFLDRNNTNRQDMVGGTRDFLQRTLEKVAAELEASDTRLKQMRAARQFELPERLETNLRKMEILEEEARTVEEALGRYNNQRTTIEQLLDETPATLAKPAGPSTAAVAAPPEPAKVTEYRKARLGYEQLTAIYPAANPDVRQAKAFVDNLRAKLSPEELEIAQTPPALPPAAEPGMPPGTEPNPRRRALETQLRDMEIEYGILQARKSTISAAKVTYGNRVENTPQIQQELADVMRENADLQKQYDDIKGKLTQAELSLSLETSEKAGNFTVQDPANLPTEPAKPSKASIAIAGTVISFLVSLVFAVIVDIARQRIWSPSEIESFWGVPVLVDIPEILTDVDVATARRKKLVFAASAIAAAMVFSVCLYGVNLKHEFILRQLDPVIQKVIYK